MSRKASGLKAWALQRITAIYVASFIVYFLTSVLLCDFQNYQQWRDWFAEPLMGIATLVFIVSMLMHVWVGLRDILIDYIKPISIRGPLLALLGLFLLACALWASQSLILVRLV